MIKLLYIDLFAGAGGTSTGVENATAYGKKCAKVIACVNHDANAIASHAANHPDALHFTEDIRTLDLTDLIAHTQRMRLLYPEASLVIWASLECTNFSNAKGGMSRDADSRTLAIHLYRYFEALNPDLIQIENVKEFMGWGPLMVKVTRDKVTGFESCPIRVVKSGKGKNRVINFAPVMVPVPDQKGIYYDEWLNYVKSYGYYFEHRFLNSADFDAFTSRTRFFGQFARYDMPISWPTPTHSKKGTNGKKKWNAVRIVLDLEDVGQSIFTPGKISSEKTFERVYSGLIKFVAEGKENFMIKYNSMSAKGKYIAPEIDEPSPVVSTQNRLGIVKVNFLSKYFSGKPYDRNISIDGPSGAITTSDHHSLVSPEFLSAYYTKGANVSSIDEPSPTITTKDRLGVVQPQVLNSYNYKDEPKDLDNPCPTLLTKDRLGLVSPQFIDQQYGNSKPSSIDKPCGTVTVNPKQALVSCSNFLMHNYTGGGQNSDIENPAPTVTAVPKQNLVTVQPWIMDTQFGNIGSSIDDPAGTITANRKWHYLMNPQYNSHGGSIDSPCFTLIARMDKMPPYLIVTEEGYAAIEVYPTDSPMTIKIKEFMALYGLVDIKMRMLKIPELKLIMGFPGTYILIGNQTEQKKHIGNAVEVNTANAICSATAAKLTEVIHKVA